MNFNDNLKNKNWKIVFSFDSAYCASFIKMGAKLRGGGLHIFSWKKPMLLSFCRANHIYVIYISMEVMALIYSYIEQPYLCEFSKITKKNQSHSLKKNQFQMIISFLSVQGEKKGSRAFPSRKFSVLCPSRFFSPPEVSPPRVLT